MLRGKSRYQELLNSEERIATNILADRLVRLEQEGLISKADDPDDKRQFRYSPTQKALDLLPVIFEMARWTAKYDPYTDPTNPVFQRMKASKEGFMKEIAAQCPAGRGSARQHPLMRGKQRPTAQGPRRERKHP